jgi:hypothetical protein
MAMLLPETESACVRRLFLDELAKHTATAELQEEAAELRAAADDAENKATLAQEEAAELRAAADDAENKATLAQEEAAGEKKAANAAQASADTAQASADAARAVADRFQVQADASCHSVRAPEADAETKPQARADAAQARADAAQARADAAQARADAAQARADAAQARADAAQARADEARACAAAARCRADATQQKLNQANNARMARHDIIVKANEPRVSELAYQPFWPVVGNVEALAEEFVRHADARDDGTHNTVEGYVPAARANNPSRDRKPFLYLLNPPRHGKSYFLDLVAKKGIAKGFRVSAVSYNGVFPVSTWEQASWLAAVRGLRLRLVFSLISYRPAAAFYETYWGNVAADAVESITTAVLHAQEVRGKMLFLVDELTNVTTPLIETLKARSEDMELFWSSLFDLQSDGRRFILTGFTARLRNPQVPSSFAFVIRALEQCDPMDTRSLGLVLYHAHQQLNATFPHLLFEVCKATPGLVGTLLWAFKMSGELADDESALTAVIPWLETLRTDRTLWRLIREVLVTGSGLEEAEARHLTVRRHGGSPELSPFAVVVVARAQPADEAAKDQVLCALLKCIGACATRTGEEERKVAPLPRNSLETVAALIQGHARAATTTTTAGGAQSTGGAFEKFTAAAIELQFQCRKPPERDLPTTGVAVKHGSLSIPVHFLTEQGTLSYLLGDVAYRLFPCGYELLTVLKTDEQAVQSAPKAKKAPRSRQGLQVERCTVRLPVGRFDPDSTHNPQPAGLDTFPGRFSDAERVTEVVNRHLTGKPFKSSDSLEIQKCAAGAKAFCEQVTDNAAAGRHFVLVPRTPCNPLCDVVVVVYRGTTEADVLLIECRDRRSMSLEDWIEKPVSLGTGATCLPTVSEHVAKAGLKLNFHLVLAGRPMDPLTSQSLQQQLLADAAAP